MLIIVNQVLIFLQDHLSIIVSTGMLFVAILTLNKSIRSINEQNRPCVNLSFEEHSAGSYFYIIVRNMGNRAATNVSISISPPLQTKLFCDHEGVEELRFSFIAPNQEIKNNFDHRIQRFQPDGVNNDIHYIDIKYYYKKKKYDEKYVMDLSYLRTWFGGDVETKADKHLNDISSSLNKIERSLKQIRLNS